MSAAGIEVSLQDSQLHFRLTPPQGDVLKLASPLPHPWLNDYLLDVVGAHPDLEEYLPLEQANQRLSKLLAGQSPQRLIQEAERALEKRLKAFLAALLTPEHLQIHEKVAFSARAALTPAVNLRSDQVGVAEKIAWDLFEPLVIRELGDAAAVRMRDTRALQALDAVMACSWVLISYTPSLTPTTILAFHPVRITDPVVSLHPLASWLLNSDFDGDQTAIHLPVTTAAQHEAGEKLTIAAHLRRDPALVARLLPYPDVMWGLAWLACHLKGKSQLADTLALEPDALSDLLTQAAVGKLLDRLFRRDGVDVALERVERLMAQAYQTIRYSGASLSPVLGRGLSLPGMPEGDDPGEWQIYAEMLTEAVLAGTDYSDPVNGSQLLAAKTRPRNRRTLPLLVGPRGLVRDAADQWAAVRHGLCEGLTPTEAFCMVAGARRGLADWLIRMDQTDPVPPELSSWTVLARARRAQHPGVVFARAAASGEIDPLSDLESRLLVGLPC